MAINLVEVEIENIEFNVTSKHLVIKGLFNFMSESSSFYLTTPPGFAALGGVVVEASSFFVF